jgi:prepilin-type N-terminal cleavage/methylation domain-containing protein
MTKQRKGFTLVELSIVLIIIGLIIGGVLKGTDLINSARTKKVYTTWIKGWQIAVNTYQDKTGQVLADGAANGGAGVSDGLFDNILLSNTTVIQARLMAVGLDVPITNTGGSASPTAITSPAGGSYQLEGKDRAGLSTMRLVFRNFSGSNRNVLELTQVPNDVAMAIDTMIDGAADAGLGNCRLNTAARAGTTLQWPASNAALSVIDIAI